MRRTGERPILRRVRFRICIGWSFVACGPGRRSGQRLLVGQAACRSAKHERVRPAHIPAVRPSQTPRRWTAAWQSHPGRCGQIRRLGQRYEPNAALLQFPERGKQVGDRSFPSSPAATHAGIDPPQFCASRFPRRRGRDRSPKRWKRWRPARFSNACCRSGASTRTVSIPTENSSFCRSRIPPPFGCEGLQFQPIGVKIKPAGEMDAGNAGVQPAEKELAATHRDGERAGSGSADWFVPCPVSNPHRTIDRSCLRHGAGTLPAWYRHQAAQRPSYGGGFLSILTTGQDLQKTTPRFKRGGAGLGFRVVVRIRAHRQRRIVSLDFKGVELIGGAAGAVSNDSA
jgi:hypothetical protein